MTPDEVVETVRHATSAALSEAEQQRQQAWIEALAKAVLTMAVDGGMPDTYWHTDVRITLACKTLGLTVEEARELGRFTTTLGLMTVEQVHEQEQKQKGTS